jgi:hypothetical protein
MQTAYLSIDLDFGNINIDQLLAILKYAKGLKVPSILVDTHDCLYRHLRETNLHVDTLINVDEHSDLYKWAPLSKDPVRKKKSSYPFNIKCLDHVHCGNWVNFTKDYASNYVWIHPSISDWGRCDYQSCDFEKIESDYKSLKSYYRDWRRIVKRYKIVGVGIAMSIADEYTSSRTISRILADDSIVEWFEEMDCGSINHMKMFWRENDFLYYED